MHNRRRAEAGERVYIPKVLLKAVEMRVADRQVLRLICLWLEAPAMQTTSWFWPAIWAGAS
jgi:hypothetical protein